uniref:Extended synaptotagmin-3 n=1 Tax=Dicentrarchus labrax TaxID=13489 RepID=A0A8P4G9C7_DICLA
MYPSGPAEGVGLGESLSIHGSTEKLSSSAVNRILMEFLMYFGRAMLVFYPVYLTGYLGLSVSWVLLCMMMVSWWKKNRQWKEARIGTAIDFVDNETHLVNRELKSALQMASWVHFPDVEKVDWVNKVLEQAWPFFGMYMEKLLKEKIQASVRLSNAALKTFTFTKVHFGRIITGMKAYTHEVDQREVVLDLNISYEGDVDIDAVVKDIIISPSLSYSIYSTLKGMLRVILEPLIGDAPLVGGVTFFFIRCPTLQINWTGMTNLLDSPAFRLETIMDIIASLMVLPNRMCIPLIDQVKVDQMRFPLPRGVVRVHLLEAKDLVAKDTYMMGLVKGKSDPYVKLRVGNRKFKSKTIKENLNPTWNEVYEFVVHEAPGQELELELYDEDTDKDDFLGSLLTESSDGFACAMLAVYLDNASNLPVSGFKQGTLTPLHFSQVVYANKDPVWEEGFNFFVHNIKTQQLCVQVKEPEKKTQLGILNLPLSRLLNSSNMTVDQRFLLEQSGAKSEIKLKATLRILTVEKPPPKIILDPPPQPKKPGPQTNQGGKAPESTPALSSNAAQASFPTQAADSQNGYSADYSTQRRGSFLASETWHPSPSPSNIRRFDSHSLLSENSIASSRFDLSEGASYPEAIRNHQGSFGEIHLTVRYATLRKKLIVLVDSCRNLFSCSENGTDSYVRLYLLPDQSWRHRKKTHVKKRTVDPVFNEKFEFDLELEDVKNRKLDVAVKNNKMFYTRERKDIGMVMIDFSRLDIAKGITQWYGALFSTFP